MGKLYFKKLFSIILFAFCILGVFFISYSILATVSNFFKHPAIRYTILMGVPTFFVLRLVNKGRIKNQNLKIDYMNYLRNLGTKHMPFITMEEIFTAVQMYLTIWDLILTQVKNS